MESFGLGARHAGGHQWERRTDHHLDMRALGGCGARLLGDILGLLERAGIHLPITYD